METDSKHEHSGHGTRDHMQMHQAEARPNVQAHSGHNHHAGHPVAVFRDKFWLSLTLTIPVVAWSSEVQHWLGYRAPSFPGSRLIPAILGTIVFAYGGSVFIQGARRELSGRQPGMMTLISLAIVVAFTASLAATLGFFQVDVWWELSTLISVMLLGHWLEISNHASSGSSQRARRIAAGH